MNVLAADQEMNGRPLCTVFGSLGSLKLVGDLFFPHICGHECLDTEGPFAKGRWVGIADGKLDLQVEALKPGNCSVNMTHASSEDSSSLKPSNAGGTHSDIYYAHLRLMLTVAKTFD